uniref:DnaJ homolog subfamily C member 22 n=1 Tax=Cuerna arida TaxID=1464854 RepID=A0A1B6FPN6_9HEMI
MAKKSIFLTYLLWLVGGFFGLHHFYLGRDIQAFLWWCTLGGYFGFGWLRDIFYIPSYVADANQDPDFVNKFVTTLRTNPKPPFSSVRFCGMVIMGYFWGSVVCMSIPEEGVAGYSLQWLHVFIPVAVALGVWAVGNIGNEEGSLWWPLVASYIVYPFYWHYNSDTSFTALVIFTAFVFDTKAKHWRTRVRPRKSFARRLTVLLICGLLYFSLWGSYFYFNAKLQNSEGEEVPVHEAIRHFFHSPWWADFKTSLDNTWQFARHNGWLATWRLIVDLGDPFGETHALQVLNLSSSANQTEINTTCRMLKVKFHPDKAKTPADKQTAQEKFYEVQQACEILSKSEAKRRRRNQKSEL